MENRSWTNGISSSVLNLAQAVGKMISSRIFIYFSAVSRPWIRVITPSPLHENQAQLGCDFLPGRLMNFCDRQDAIYGNRYFLSTGAVGTCKTGRVLICTSLSHVSKGLRDRHSGVRESHVMLSYVCESLRDRCWSASCSLALRYKFARLSQGKQS